MKRSGCIYKEGKTFSIRWSENGRRPYQSGFLTRADAAKALAHILGQIALGRAGVPEAEIENTQTLGDLVPGWLDRRDHTHRAARDDRQRWMLHLGPFFGRMRPSEVGPADIERFIVQARRKLSPATIAVCVSVLSAFYRDLMERRPPLATVNPCRGLTKQVRRLMKSTTDSESVPFVEKLSDVRLIFLALPEPVNVAYALGAMAGLRTGEIIGLRWEAVDLAAKTINVRVQADRHTGEDRDPKSGKPRRVPIVASLLPVLTE